MTENLDKYRNINKEIAWEILRCAILCYEGKEPTYYGFREIEADIGKKLADALYRRAERLIKHYLSEGKLIRGEKGLLKWGKQHG